MSYSDVLKDKIVLAVIAKSDPGSSIAPDKWKFIPAKLLLFFIQIMKENPGPPPRCSDGGWNQGHVKLIACADQRSYDLYKLAIAKLGEVWPGARLEVVAKEDIPSRPRTRTWIPAEPSNTDTILGILRTNNPDLPTHNWKIAKLDEPKGLYRCAIIVINKEPLGSFGED